MRKSSESFDSHHAGIMLVLLVASVSPLLASCEGIGRGPGPQDDIEDSVPAQVEQGSTTAQGSVTLEELTQRPDRFYGERETVGGRVGRTMSASTFALTSVGTAESNEAFEVESALVAGGDGSIPKLTEGRRVRMTGEVQRLNLKEIEQELNTDLEDSLYADFEEKPAILTGTVEVLAGGETTGRAGR